MTAMIGTTVLLACWIAGVAIAAHGRRVATHAFAEARVPAHEVLRAQLIGTALNRVMPAGTGLIATHLRLLQRQGISQVGSTATLGAYAAGGAFAHVLLMAGAVTALTAGVLSVPMGTSLPSVSMWWLAAAVVLIVLTAAGIRRCAPRLWGSAAGTASAAWSLLRARPGCLTRLMLLQVLAQGLLGVGLLAALYATGTTVSPVAVLVVSVLGTSVAAALPTPGGSGPVEAGLVGGLLLLGVTFAAAAAAVGLFRLVTHWLPVPVGIAVAFNVRRRRRGPLQEDPRKRPPVVTDGSSREFTALQPAFSRVG
jgi:uncharacterized membrane protein YbhN (UPF0104 family)